MELTASIPFLVAEVEGGLSRPEPKQHDMKAFLAGFRNKPKTE
jgi:hypothetical protein